VTCGIVLAWLAFGTSAFSRFELPARPTAGEILAATIVWSSAVIAPGLCVVVGLRRLASSVGYAVTSWSNRTVIDGLARTLGDGHYVAPQVRLPDKSIIPGVVVGPHGVAVLGIAPSDKRTRRTERGWEARLADGQWVPIEDPLDRVRRDADRVRSWFAAEDRDFVVKVHAALITSDSSIPRTPTCAVVTREQVGMWLGRLPIQRTLTLARLERLVRRIADLSGGASTEHGG
jgi:hypothetical protein